MGSLGFSVDVEGVPFSAASPLSILFTPSNIPLIEVEALHVNAAGFLQKQAVFISLPLACNVPASALAFPL